MKQHKFLTFLFFFCSSLQCTFAQSGSDDFMRSVGKIYVVVAVIVAIFIGIVAFLIYMEKRLTKLENQIPDNE